MAKSGPIFVVRSRMCQIDSNLALLDFHGRIRHNPCVGIGAEGFGANIIRIWKQTKAL